jgi:predicted TIM-barrel fold metal-dependent hydrolase
MSLVVDVHSHFYPKIYLEALSKKGIIIVMQDKILLKWGNRGSNVDFRAIDINKKLEDLKKLPYKFYSLLSISAPWTYILPREEEIRVVRECNNELAQIVDKNKEYFGGLATLPLNDVNESINEAERAINDLGLQGFVIGTGIGNKTIADEEYKPLLKKISQLGKPIFLHPGTLPLDKVLNEGAVAIAVSFIFETSYVISKLALDGSLREYNLKIIVPHGGGVIPYQLGRVDLAFEAYGMGKVKPSEDLLKYVYYDTVLYTKESLKFLYDIVGFEHVVFGTDHPFPVSKPLLFLKFIDEITPNELKSKVYNENARKLFKLNIS